MATGCGHKVHLLVQIVQKNKRVTKATRVQKPVDEICKSIPFELLWLALKKQTFYDFLTKIKTLSRIWKKNIYKIYIKYIIFFHPQQQQMQIVSKKFCPAWFPPRIIANGFAGVSMLPLQSRNGLVSSSSADLSCCCRLEKKVHQIVLERKTRSSCQWNHCHSQPVHSRPLTGPPGDDAENESGRLIVAL